MARPHRTFWVALAVGLPANAKHAGQDADHVAIEDGQARVVCDGEHGTHGIAAEAGQAAQRGRVTGHDAAVGLDDGARGAMQVLGPPVEAESTPGREDFVVVRRSEGGDRGEAGEETLVVALDRVDLRLLEHDFADPDRVRIARAPPGQTARRLGEPGQEPGREGGWVGSVGERGWGLRAWHRGLRLSHGIRLARPSV